MGCQPSPSTLNHVILLSLQIVSGIGIITAIYALASEGTAEKAADKVARRDDIGVGGGG